MKSKIQKLFSVIPIAIGMVFLAVGFMSFSSTQPVVDEEIQELNEPGIGGAYLIFAERFGGEVTRKDLMNHKEIQVEGCAKGSKIFQYTLHITRNGKTNYFRGMSYMLTKEMLTELRSLAVGDEFIFKKVKAHLPDGKSVVDVWGKKFTVV